VSRMLISLLLILVVCNVKDISARIPCVLSSCLVLVLVFPVCINQNQHFSLSLVVYTVKDISVRIPFVLSSCLVLVLVFPVCINQNLLFSFVFLAAYIVKDIVFRILLSRLVLFYVLH